LGGLGERIAARVAQVTYDDADALERVTAEIRALITGAPLPATIATPISEAYAAIGDDVFVAVRSSGTAEDLAEASFAGMHDTYLDIAGTDAVLDAVKCCWASLWTARATSYRHAKSFGHKHGIAVVVQTMVPAEVSGVMFTANPITTATDEIVINASFGLGEAIVSGITLPDTYVIDTGRLRVKERTLGTKEKRVVRDPKNEFGTIVQETPAAKRGQFSLSADQAVGLARLGLRVQQHYGDFPQDVEWAFANGQFYLLQARPVTGVDLTWDADIDAWQWLSPAPDDTVWTRAWSDEAWTGAITPLFYSYRAHTFTFSNEGAQTVWNQPQLSRLRIFKYYQGSAYYNCEIDRQLVSNTAFPSTRNGMLANIPPAWHTEVLKAPFKLSTYLNMQLRMQFL
ncbi:MAG: PEP/pyruvate-binding domain-containing protein, partial [Gammaproteobacteria bacterium]